MNKCSVDKKARPKVCILGGGNIGSLLLADLSKKASMRLFTSRPEKWKKEIEVYDSEDNLEYTGHIEIISDNPEEVIPDADIIISTIPTHIFPNVIGRIKSYINPKTWLGIMPGSGGKEFYLREALNNEQIIFGFQRVHGISRIKEYGSSVYDLGKKSELFIGSLPSDMAPDISDTIEGLIGIPCIPVPNYLSITLTPSNPILHTSRLYSLFKNYENTVWHNEIFFYREWDDFASNILIGADSELQLLCSKIEELDLSYVRSLKEHYESNTTQKMSNKIRSIKAFKDIKAPMIKDAGRYIPDFNSRYFKEDFPYGLCIIKSFCYIAGIGTPIIDEMLQWYASTNNLEYYVDGKFEGKDLEDLLLPQNYGINSVADIVKFYS